ncbi:hypothetical protein [Endozoicomonas sp.]|uniref:hypothetical protein n=1 Tax=Endozoicomonas sp. TaxID=1892382 RepID=UPI002884BD3F|nr:hypothetical protein [Endozoicomonas sp.]
MKNGDRRDGIFTPVFKGNYPLCLQKIAGKSIEWKYMGESTMPPVGAGLFMAVTDNKVLCDQKYWVYEDAIDFDSHH